MSEQTDDIDIMDEEAVDAYIADLDAQIEDNKENDGDESEFSELLEKRTEAHKTRNQAKEKRETRQSGVRGILQGFNRESIQLQAKLAESDLDAGTEAELRARQTFVDLRREELTASLPFAGIGNDKLEEQLEEAEYQREELRDKLDQALAPGGKPSAHARRFQAELDALDQGRWALERELQTRTRQEQNQALAHAAAERHAERELRAEDHKAFSETEEDWQRVKLTKEQTESFATRLKERIPAVEKRLWREAEENVTRSIMFNDGIEFGWRDRDRKIREDEAKVKEWRKRYEQAANSQ